MAIVGYDINNSDQVLYVLGRLISDYASIIINIIQKKRVPSLDKVFRSIRIQGKQMERMNSVSSQQLI